MPAVQDGDGHGIVITRRVAVSKYLHKLHKAVSTITLSCWARMRSVELWKWATMTDPAVSSSQQSSESKGSVDLRSNGGAAGGVCPVDLVLVSIV